MVSLDPPEDARVFAGRLIQFDPGAVIRLRPGGPGRTAVWAQLPWGVLVTREVEGDVPADVTVAARDLLHASDQDGREPPRRDADWRGALPPAGAQVLEEVPARRLREVAAAAAGTLRQVTSTGLDGRAVGARVLREALLRHVAVVVEADTDRVEVPQRLVQAVVRMGFLGSGDGPVRVLRAARWVGLAAPYGTAWLPPPVGLSVRTV